MENITSATELKIAIQILETEQDIKAQLIKEQFILAHDSIKPINLLKSTVNDFVTSPYLIDNILGGAVGLATGYLSKKIVIGASGNLFRKLLGVVMQFGVTNAVSQHPEGIRSIGQYIFKHIIPKKKLILNNRDN
jgi:hypothetical protein